MKVFNWVRWTFPHAHSEARKENGVEKNGMRSSKKVDHDHDEKHVLLDDHDVINNWDDRDQDGLILAIGTLGVGPLVDNMQSHEDDLADHDYDDNLLSLMMFRHENGCKEIEEVSNEDDDSIVKIRRVTLADLFSENSNSDYSDHDHDYDDHHDYCTVKEAILEKEKNIPFVEKQPSCFYNTKKNISEPKKKAKKKLRKDDFHPLNVFNQLMKRMMKKKIHPDMELGKMKKDIEMQPSRRDHQVGPHHESASSSLLIQGIDAMI